MVFFVLIGYQLQADEETMLAAVASCVYVKDENKARQFLNQTRFVHQVVRDN